MYTIGVDIGGTNTDAVLLNEKKQIIGSVKCLTTADIDDGFFNAIFSLLQKTNTAPQIIGAVFVGTTHATNALLQKNDLYRVGLIRIAGQKSTLLPPCFGWPMDLKQTLLVDFETIDGGHECSGKEISAFNLEEARGAIDRLLHKGAESFAIVGAFSPLYPQHEEMLGRLIGEEKASLSYKIGGMGIVERENSTILNAALRRPLEKGFLRLKDALQRLSLDVSLYITQNNGTIISLETALKYPVLTISAGPTNSFIGGAKLAGCTDCIVVDIGGTSTDVGVVKNGFPRRSLGCSNIGGIALNFPMPDVLSIALGGGSYVSLNPIAIGPKSAAKNIGYEAICFGGDKLTFTDIALFCDPELIPGAARAQIQMQEAEEILSMGAFKIERLVQKIAGSDTNLPVIVVGGGAELVKGVLDPSRYIIPNFAGVANAFGAALSEISGTVDLVVSLTERESVLREITRKSIDLAISLGANQNDVRLVDLQIFPYHYVPGTLARVIATAAGKQ